MLIAHKALNGKAPHYMYNLIELLQVLHFHASSMLLSLNTPGVTCLFLQLRFASGTLYHLILDLVFVPQNSNLFSKLTLHVHVCHRFSRTKFVVFAFFRSVFGFTAF